MTGAVFLPTQTFKAISESVSTITTVLRRNKHLFVMLNDVRSKYSRVTCKYWFHRTPNKFTGRVTKALFDETYDERTNNNFLALYCFCAFSEF